MLDKDHRTAVEAYESAATTGGSAPQPWELIVERIRSMGARLQLSEATFPIQVVLPMVGKYHIEEVLGENGMGTGVRGGGSGRTPQNGGPSQDWVPDAFMSVGVPFETLVTVLESMFYGNEAPWIGKRNRGIVGAWMICVIQKWFEESLTAGAAGGLVFGGEENAMAVLQTLRGVETAAVLNTEAMEEARILRARIEGALR